MHTWPNLLSSSPTGPGHPSHRMPEGPELHLASHFVNEACRELVFGGCVEKSLVSHNPEVPFASSAYRISAIARGKELRLTLSPLPGAQPPREPLALVFRFGMTGSFQLVPSDALPPHAHLRFYTAPPGPRLALCFVDIRRFGRWDLGGTWQPGRGPCVLLEYEQFRENVLRNLADKAFDRPICEALLDQRFFNGIGNYLRAEILYRLRIPPFEKARSVLEALQQRRPVRVQGGTCTHLSVQADKGLGWVRCLQLSTGRSLLSFQPVSLSLQCVCGGGAGGQTNCLSPAKLRRGLFPKGSAAFRVALPHAVIQVLPLPLLQSPELTLSQKIRAKLQNPDLLELCHLVPKEVIQLGGKGYGPESGEEDFAAFQAWLRCYGMPGMSSLRDRHNRTIWFQDPPPPNKAPARTRRARRSLPEQITAQQLEGTSLQQDPEAPPVPEKGKRRRRQPATSGRRRPQKIKADTPSLEPEGTSAS
ncbi:endonuclease 8-like 1 isoform X3 [Hippopotamus amphibius kiboko]|uniref:endonuclease 8-like 1 isoform X3 n=1 Tax=Hippopotamus amphibius kiboko TaxID=575201 RepID=UPI00259A4A1B|nr:endonuclease 8-like 1 isoform X3 [Hippopotamus amphibius kiboko]